MRKMWSFLLAALALTGCAAAPADALPAAETAEMTATETEETAAQPVGFTVGNLSEVPNTCGGYWGWNTGDAYYEIARLDDENDQESMHALLLKTDYATAQQTVLCNVPGCTHDNAACPAWLEDWARTDVLVMPSGIYLSYAGLDDTSPWEQVEKACRDDFEQGNVKNFADEEAYIDYCRHNYELSSRPSSIEKLNDDLTARDTHEFLNRVQTFARRNNVVDDKDTLAFHSVDVELVKIKRLNFRRRDGLHLNLNGIDHISFQALSGKKIIFAFLFRHLVRQRNTLRFRRDDKVVFGCFFQKFFRAPDGHFDVGKHDESGYVKVFVNRANG